MGARWFLAILAFAMVCGVILVSSAMLTPVVRCTAIQSTVGIRWRVSLDMEDTVSLAEGSTLVPVRHFDDIQGRAHLLVKSAHGLVLVRPSVIDIQVARIPFRTRLGWVLGWNMTTTEDRLSFQFGGKSYSLVRFWFLKQYGPLWNLHGANWVLVFMLLMIWRSAQYPELAKVRIAQYLAVILPVLGIANIALWYCLLTQDGLRITSAVSGIAINVACAGLVTVPCESRADETWLHNLTSIVLASLIVFGLNVFVQSQTPTLRLLILCSPVGVLYVVTDAICSRFSE